MKVSTLRAVKVAGLIGLPLIALLAVALFVTLGNSTTDTAEAAHGATGMSLVTPATVEVDQKFDIGLVTDDEPAVGIAGFAAEILIDPAGINYNGSGDCSAEVKVSPTPLCQSVLTAAGGRGIVTLADIGAVPVSLFNGSPGIVGLANLSYICKTAGVYTVTLTANPTSPDGAAYTIADLSLVLVKNDPSDEVNITCTEPAGLVQIDKTDSETGALLGGTCWSVAHPSAGGDVVIDVVGDNGKACAGTTGAVGADKNATAGEIDITISGLERLNNGDVWSFQETQPPSDKYNADPEKLVCDFSLAADNPCVGVAENVLKVGTINATWTDKVDGSLAGDPEQCYVFKGGLTCDNDAQDKNPAVGIAEHNVPFGNHECVLEASSIPAGRILDEAQGVATQNCDTPDNSAGGRKATVSWSYSAAVPQWQKDVVDDGINVNGGSLANLFLTAQGAKLDPLTCEQGSDLVTFREVLSRGISSGDPKGIGGTQVIAGFEVEVRFDAKLVCVNIQPAFAADDGIPPTGAFCVTKQLDGIASIHCASLKGSGGLPLVDNVLALIEVRPQPDLYSFIIANQFNGIVAQIIDQGCKLTDELGHPIPILSCEDADVTIRFLEGDVNADCEVTALDEQQLAFRWGSSLGNLIYNARYDLEPSADGASGNLNGDGDIDINDLQFVFGRHGSLCSNPNPSYQANPENAKTP